MYQQLTGYEACLEIVQVTRALNNVIFRHVVVVFTLCENSRLSSICKCSMDTRSAAL
jgi:hypothetical protein